MQPVALIIELYIFLKALSIAFGKNY